MRPHPPFYFLIALLTMAGLHYLVPGTRWIAGPWRYLGFIPAAAGLFVILCAAGLFRKRGTTLKPFKESSALVIEGPFRFTRNPMYLSLLITLTGAAVVLGTVTPLLVLPAFAWLITALFIRKEEAMLIERFGEAYEDYREKVRRWL